MAKMNERYQLSFGQKILTSIAALGIAATSMLPYRSTVYAQDIALLPSNEKSVEQPEPPAKEPSEPAEPVEPSEPAEPASEKPAEKGYHFSSFERLKDRIDLKGKELYHTREAAFGSVERYHTHARNLVEDVSNIAEYLNRELIREYEKVRDLESADLERTSELREYRRGRIEFLDALRNDVQKLLDSLPTPIEKPVEVPVEPQDNEPEVPVDTPVPEQQEQPQESGQPVQPEAPVETPEQETEKQYIDEAEEQLRRLDRAFPDGENSYNNIEQGYRRLAAVLVALSAVPTSLDVPVAGESQRVGPVEIYRDLYNLATERTGEMNSFLDRMEGLLKSDLADQNAVVSEMSKYQKFVDEQLGALEARQKAFEDSFEWTEAESNRIRELLGEPSGK